jgi:hypothetical protein
VGVFRVPKKERKVVGGVHPSLPRIAPREPIARPSTARRHRCILPGVSFVTTIEQSMKLPITDFGERAVMAPDRGARRAPRASTANVPDLRAAASALPTERRAIWVCVRSSCCAVWCVSVAAPSSVVPRPPVRSALARSVVPVLPSPTSRAALLGADDRATCGVRSRGVGVHRDAQCRVCVRSLRRPSSVVGSADVLARDGGQGAAAPRCTPVAGAPPAVRRVRRAIGGVCGRRAAPCRACVQSLRRPSSAPRPRLSSPSRARS